MIDNKYTKPIEGNYRVDTVLKSQTFYLRNFESLDSFYDVLFKHSKNKEYSSHRFGPDAMDFTGTYDFEEAVNLARYGWEDGLKKLEYYEDMADKDFADKYTDNIWDVQNDVTGSYVDVGSYIQGLPECMCDFVSKKSNTFADILVNCVVPAWTDKDSIIERGREIIKLVDVLEKRHIKTRVNLMSVTSDGCDSEWYIVSVLCKDYNEYLDQSKLVFALAHPSMERRFMFAMEELETDIREKFNCPHGGYGHAKTISKLPEEIWKSKFENTYTFIFDDIKHTKEDIKVVKEKVKEFVTKENI